MRTADVEEAWTCEQAHNPHGPQDQPPSDL